MSDVNIQLVREFFELNAFRTMTFWQHDDARPRAGEHGLQLFAENGAPTTTRPIEFVLRPGDVCAIDRALVEVRAWHADRFYASVIEANPVLFDVAGEDSRARANGAFGGAPYRTILVISEFSTSPEPRQRAIALLRQAGIDHVIEFPMILRDILDRISPQASYGPSQTLQTLRLLKRYDFIRYQQLELPFRTEPPYPVSPTPSSAETVLAPESDESED